MPPRTPWQIAAQERALQRAARRPVQAAGESQTQINEYGSSDADATAPDKHVLAKDSATTEPFRS